MSVTFSAFLIPRVPKPSSLLRRILATMSNLDAPEEEMTTIQRDRKAMAEYRLYSDELYWRDRYVSFKARGYLLRPRYNPEWVASWKGTNKNWLECEDGLIGEVLHEPAIHFIRVLTILFEDGQSRDVCEPHLRRGPSCAEETCHGYFDK
jgi:hypothetical protein